jgi:hypothetical protein
VPGAPERPIIEQRLPFGRVQCGGAVVSRGLRQQAGQPERKLLDRIPPQSLRRAVLDDQQSIGSAGRSRVVDRFVAASANFDGF